MRAITIADDGTTTIEFTDAEAHALRDELAAFGASDAARSLQRLLAVTHGETATNER